jgi:iron complex outermembrane receptor protein
MTKRILHLSLIAAMLYGGPLRAEDGAGESADDLNLVRLLNVEVSTATKTAESVEDAPAIITVVTRDDMARWGYQSVAEVLDHTLGFYLVDDHILPNAAVRGVTGGLRAESGVIKVMIDGRSVAYRTTSGNWLGVELIPLGSVKQIEIIRGPASALYGADAFLGVVNIITLKPEDVRPLRARGSIGLTGTNPGGRFDVVGGGMLGPFDLMLGAAGEKADRSGLTLPEESPAPTLPSDIGERRHSLNLARESLVLQGRVGYRDKRTVDLVLSAYGSGIQRGGDFAHWAQLTNTSGGTDSERGTVVALQQLRLDLDALIHASQELDLALQGTFFQGGTLPRDRIDVASDLYYIERNESYRGVDSAFEVRWTPGDRFNSIIGVETVYDHERMGAPTRVSLDTGEEFLLDDATTPGDSARLFNVGTYLSVNLKVLDPWLKLTGGGRYDRHSEYGDQITGRLGATSRLSEELVAKLLYGSAFKAPSPYLLYATPLRPGDVIGRQDLKSQLVHTVEFQMSYTPSRFVGVTSGVAQSWLLDKAEFTPQGINQAARNVASQRTFSWETRGDIHYYDDVRWYGSFEHIWSERDLGREGYVADLVGSSNVAYPTWIGRTGLLVGIPAPPTVPLELGSEAILVGPRRADEMSIVENGANLRLDPYLLLDISLATRAIYLAPGHESRFALRTRNILNTRGPDPGVSGFAYPLRPGEIFFEFEHVY